MTATTMIATGLRRSARRSTKPLNTVLGVIIVAAMLFPVYWMVNASFQPSGNTLSGEWFPLQPTLAGYQEALRSQGQNLLTSLVVALGTVVLTLVIATPAAYALAQFRYRWLTWALLTVVITQMIPTIVIANALYTFFNDLGLLNSVIGLILADATHSIPFAILIMRASMLGIPTSILEAARLDGASALRTFVSVAVPVARNSIITAGLFSFLFAWGDFVFALTLTTGENVRPVTLGIYQYLGTEVGNWGAVMATAVLSALPAIVLLVLAQRFIAAGATGGAVK